MILGRVTTARYKIALLALVLCSAGIIVIISADLSAGDDDDRALLVTMTRDVPIEIRGNALFSRVSGEPMAEVNAVVAKYRLYDIAYSVSADRPQFLKLQVPDDIALGVVIAELSGIGYVRQVSRASEQRFSIP